MTIAQAEHLRRLQEDLNAATTFAVARGAATVRALAGERRLAAEAVALRQELAVERAARAAEDLVLRPAAAANSDGTDSCEGSGSYAAASRRGNAGLHAAGAYVSGGDGPSAAETERGCSSSISSSSGAGAGGDGGIPA
jgi:hypothetical protein